MTPFSFDDEQRELRRTLRSLLTARSGSERVREVMGSTEPVDRTLWSQVAGQMGLAGLLIPEEFGGAGYTFVETAIVAEELGRFLACVPFLSSAVFATGALLEVGTPEAKREMLPALAAGELTASVALLDGDARGWELADVALSVDDENGVLRISGRKRLVIDGATADVLLVVVRHAGGLSLVSVRTDAPGVSVQPRTTLDQTRGLADVEFDAAQVELVSEPGRAEAGLSAVLDMASAALAAESVGGAQRCLEMAVEYAKTRYQFGRPIGSYQAISHKCADMMAAVELSRSAAQYAAWAVAHEEPAETAIAVATAQAFCSDAYLRVAGDNIQVHGGIGFTWEHDAHLYFKRAKAAQLLFGDAVDGRRRLGQLLKF
jgi:alkylation response protein AidB-like acyl-CoA dehydrogenase